MKLSLSLDYYSSWGQILFVCGNDESLGNWDTERAARMEYAGNNRWTTQLELPLNKTLEYKYFVREGNGYVSWEGSANRLLDTGGGKEIFVRDVWQPATDPQGVMNTKVFTEVILKPSSLFRQRAKTKTEQKIRFVLHAPRVGKGYAVALVGDSKALGNWNKPVLMGNKHYPYWQLEIDRQEVGAGVNYKYVILSRSSAEVTTWEEGPNRQLPLPDHMAEESLYIVNDVHFRYPVGNWKGAGVAVPIFSLRSDESFGVGEFNDLKKLVDWSAKTGLKMIQVLPINETVATHSWLDSYPYKSISVMALHPMYLHLPAMGILNDPVAKAEFDQLKNQLNAMQVVDYVKMFGAKARYFKLIFDQNWEKVKKQKDYLHFFEENKNWLLPYASFCYLRDQFKTSDFTQWKEYATFNPEKIARLCDPENDFHEHIAVHYFIQYHLDLQLREAIGYAHSKGIGIKGDIPIGISRNSIEAWSEPELFNLNGQAGAPPDDFAVMGQNWGFPTYNWEVMAQDGYAWWRKRLKMMEKYFDAYRIDHILGFFRIWEIPIHALHGLQGFFKPGLPLQPGEFEDWGLWFDEERFTKPYIRGHFLHDFFGEYTEEVRAKYLTETDYGVFELKEFVDTQQKIYQLFSPNGQTADVSGKDIILRDGLMSLLNEVLFIKDPYASPAAYHPRIAFHFTYSYRDLEPHQKDSLNDLYIDFFYKRHDEFWKWHAMSKLPAIVAASNMLVCGEDLGMVPDSVPDVMAALNILSLEIQRMPKNPKVQFGHPADAPYLSVCTTSTHDMSTIRGWWEEDRVKTNMFYKHILGHNDEAPYYAEPWVCREIINQHLHSPAMWTIFPIQDLIAMDGNLRWDQTDKERINVPSNPENKWRYRMTLTLDELLEADEFNRILHGLVHASGRDSDY